MRSACNPTNRSFPEYHHPPASRLSRRTIEQDVLAWAGGDVMVRSGGLR
jgi:hypothetical protein